MKFYKVWCIVFISIAMAAQAGRGQRGEALEASSQLVPIVLTNVAQIKGADVDSLRAPGRVFFAQYNNQSQATKWRIIENNDDANALQMLCYKGFTMSIKWYYVDSQLRKS